MVLRLIKGGLSLVRRKKKLTPELFSLMQGIKMGSSGPAGSFEDDTIIKIQQDIENLKDSKRKDSPRKKRIKERIRNILRKHERITSEQLSAAIKLSRTRCNEYLKELERDNQVTWFDHGKRRYYRLLEEMENPEEIELPDMEEPEMIEQPLEA